MAVSQFLASPVTVYQQLLPNGHEIRFNFSLCNAAALEEEWSFTQDYRAPCEISPTSWKFRLTFKRHKNCLLVFGHVTLQRNDSTNAEVSVFLEVKISHDNMFKGFSPFPAVSKKILPGEEIRAHIRDITPNCYYRYLLHQELSVDVSIRIQTCHQRCGMNPCKSEDGPEIKELKCSKL